jgi:hypothetical protein
MARILIVTDLHQNVQAAFTVEAECRDYLIRNNAKYLMVLKLLDGVPACSQHKEYRLAEQWLIDHAWPE